MPIMKKLMSTLCLILTLSAQASITELPSLDVLMNELNASIVAIQRTLDPLDKESTCYHIGKSLSIVEYVNHQLKLEQIQLDKRAESNFNNLFKRVQKFKRYCENKLERITLDGAYLLSRSNRSAKNLTRVQSDNEVNSSEEVFRENISWIKNKFTIKIQELPLNFNLPMDENSEAILFKPTSCLAIGKIVPYYQMIKVYQQQHNRKVLSVNSQFDFLMKELKDICFNQRGYSKYVRDVRNLREALGDTFVK
jgi:hypothetical protein